MFYRNLYKKLPLIVLLLLPFLVSGCLTPKSKQKSATMLKASDASQVELEKQVDFLASVDAMRAKMDLKFEDNSFAEFGSADVWRSADLDIVVQRPASIRMKVEVPVIGSDVAQMTSDGTNFRLAILMDGGSGKNKKFILGTNAADYSTLEERVDEFVKDDPKQTQKSANAFKNLRPQHFTDALLVRPIAKDQFIYVTSSVLIEETDHKLFKKKDPLGWVLRSYYLLDEYVQKDDGSLKITRRFWFDRVGGALLSRQQIFSADGEIETDIVYGRRGPVSEDGSLKLPLEVQVTKPKEKYRVTLKYKAPSQVKIGKRFPESAFVLENDFGLEVLDLDKKLAEGRSDAPENVNPVEARKQN